jgi:magnesium-transporting ATPase (P-type)
VTALTSVTFVVVAVPEGLLLPVILTLAFATKRMTIKKLLICIPSSCETTANDSVVCTDKTGTLTRSIMSVVAGSISIYGKFLIYCPDDPFLRTIRNGEPARLAFIISPPPFSTHMSS